MAKQVQKWEANDGTLFDTQIEAGDHDAVDSLMLVLTSQQRDWRYLAAEDIFRVIYKTFDLKVKP